MLGNHRIRRHVRNYEEEPRIEEEEPRIEEE
jgi:hypothetical protein